MGAVLPMKYRLFAYTLGWPPHRRDPSQEKLCGQIPASMLERAIQERLGRANLGLNVRHDLDIEPATRSVPSLPGNVCSTRSDGLLIGYKVACQFESHPLQRGVTNAWFVSRRCKLITMEWWAWHCKIKPDATAPYL
jgi:hypothetical protein